MHYFSSVLIIALCILPCTFQFSQELQHILFLLSIGILFAGLIYKSPSDMITVRPCRQAYAPVGAAHKTIGCLHIHT